MSDTSNQGDDAKKQGDGAEARPRVSLFGARPRPRPAAAGRRSQSRPRRRAGRGAPGSPA